jgi:hypothetical protein
MHHFGGFFHDFCFRQPIGKKDCTPVCCPPKPSVIIFEYKVTQKFELLLKIREKNLKPVHCKKVREFPVPSRDVTTKL